jgi:hypothetical protein
LYFYRPCPLSPTSNAPRRYSREEFVQLLDDQLGRLETTVEVQRNYSKLLQVLRKQLEDFAATKASSKRK